MKIASQTLSEYCPSLLLLHQYVEMLGITANRTLLRKELIACPNYPNISLRDIIKFLDIANIASSTMRLTPEVIGHLEPPFIAQVKEENGAKYLNLVKKMADNQIVLYAPNQGETIVTYLDFIDKWTGIVLVAGASGDLPEIPSKRDPELLAIEKYKKKSIKLIPDFFSRNECLEIIDYTESRNGYFKSTVTDKNGEVKIDGSRTSYSINLSSRELSLYPVIRDRTADMLKVRKSHIEGLQCVRYASGQWFNPHLDTNDKLRRRHTLLVYLNEDFSGGETYFPELMLKISPSTGKALHFMNEDSRGNILPFSLHAGLPVQNGVKYACNIWVKSRPATH
ncbi:2OG-Fe(II) oxygenase [Dyadobacter chenwenxiniae]|uniref:2OG-Fe(II) oxygenase n=1 Tax=Dyadobacter chenwenxiniae TaxID=2906456 RepID=A0A9X1PN36_9BACT|nr:2OG-Fe(II) oxygenase [Dyadobacter chenwenxiniae]MCF0064402.1 2OG-Fe(II) oxygenase [Dyadobacter chenwenxiniae]UON82393.1 2OG-Fe(II) oxygenase [Dyadobacter chenwenxiniae]